MLKVYSKEDHEMIASWYKERGQEPIPHEYYPQVGVLYPQVAAGFLYQTDGGLCFIENYISNPKSDPKIREQAIDMITTSLLGIAKKLKFKRVLAITNNKAVTKYCWRYGFKDTGTYQVYAKEI